MVPNIFQLVIFLDAKTNPMDMVLKIMIEGNACFQHLKSVTNSFIKFLYSLAAKPNLALRQAFATKDSVGKIFEYCFAEAKDAAHQDTQKV